MSPKRDKTVPQLVEKYRQKYPQLDRDLLRKLIRLENKIVNPSELKKLDRYLKKSYSEIQQKESTIATPQTSKPLSEKDKIELAKELAENDPRAYLWADPFQHYLNILDKRDKRHGRK